MRLRDLSDEALAFHARAEPRAAFEVLFERYRGPLWNFILRQGVPGGRAEDLFQNTFLKAFRAIRGFREEGSFKTWLYAIAVNILRDEHRGPRGAARFTEIREETVAVGSKAHDDAERSEALERIKEALSEVEPQQRQLFTLVRYQGLSIAAAADAVGLGLSAAKMTLCRMRKRICESLESMKESR